MQHQDMQVELLRHVGDDLAVVNAARVSFDKESDWVKECEEYIVDRGPDVGHDQEWVVVDALSEPDKKLIKYLAKHNHFTPFTHCFATFRITCPIAVARQLHKHQVGLSVNEVSRRYVSTEPTFYVPPVWRGKAENKKQGSAGVVEPYDYGMMDDKDRTPFEWAYQHCLEAYLNLLDAGVCEEQARLVLPVGSNTTFIWSGSLAAWARVINLRTSDDAQPETRIVAGRIASHISSHFPVSYEALCDVR